MKPLVGSLRLGCAVLPVLLSTGCGVTPGGGSDDDPQSVTVRFAAMVGDQPAGCGRMYSGLGTTTESAQLLDVRFYVSRMRLIDDAGQETPLELDQDGRWQVQDVALLDFEDGTGMCSDLGTTEVNDRVTGTVPRGTYSGLAFDVGVPFELNHADLASAPAPLNVGAMFWAWAIGHKFMRVDLETATGLRWNMHLGSTMCASDGPADPPVSTCGRPNVVQVRLDAFDPDVDEVIVDLQALFASSDLTSDTPETASGCQTFPNDVNECMTLFPNLGLDFSTGACVDGCAGQQVFRAR